MLFRDGQRDALTAGPKQEAELTLSCANEGAAADLYHVTARMRSNRLYFLPGGAFPIERPAADFHNIALFAPGALFAALA